MCRSRARKSEKERRLYGSIGGACTATRPPVPLPSPLRHQSTDPVQCHLLRAISRACRGLQICLKSITSTSNSRGTDSLKCGTGVCEKPNLPGHWQAQWRQWSPEGSLLGVTSLLWKVVQTCLHQSSKYGFQEGRKHCCRGARRG